LSGHSLYDISTENNGAKRLNRRCFCLGGNSKKIPPSLHIWRFERDSCRESHDLMAFAQMARGTRHELAFGR